MYAEIPESERTDEIQDSLINAQSLRTLTQKLTKNTWSNLSQRVVI